MSASISVILCGSSATSLLFSSCGLPVGKTLCPKHGDTSSNTCLQGYKEYPEKENFSFWDVQSGRAHQKCIPGVRHEGLHIQPCMWQWCGYMHHEIQSSWEGVRGPGKEDNTDFFLVSSPAPWTTHTPKHLLPGYSPLDRPVVLLVPLVQSSYSSPPSMNTDSDC